jgi:hypothetical protein
VLLHQLRLRGSIVASSSDDVDDLCTAGLATRAGDKVVLTPEGRALAEVQARLAAGSDDEAAAQRAYDQFLPINAELLRVCSDWQVRPGNIPNDHRDSTYDWSVIDRVSALDERVGPVLRRLGTAVDRFAGYRPRLADALRRVSSDEKDWLVSPRIDSYHTVWMLLHEDLLLALGRERGEERA